MTPIERMKRTIAAKRALAGEPQPPKRCCNGMPGMHRSGCVHRREPAGQSVHQDTEAFLMGIAGHPTAKLKTRE